MNTRYERIVQSNRAKRAKRRTFLGELRRTSQFAQVGWLLFNWLCGLGINTIHNLAAFAKAFPSGLRSAKTFDSSAHCWS